MSGGLFPMGVIVFHAKLAIETQEGVEIVKAKLDRYDLIVRDGYGGA